MYQGYHLIILAGFKNKNGHLDWVYNHFLPAAINSQTSQEHNESEG